MCCYSPPPACGGRGWGRWAVPPQKPSSPNPLLQRRRGLCSCDSSHPLAEGAGFDVATPLRPLAGGGGGSATSPSSPNPLLQRRRGLCSCDSPHPLAEGAGFDVATPLRPLAGGGAGGGGGSATSPSSPNPLLRRRRGLRSCDSSHPLAEGAGFDVATPLRPLAGGGVGGGGCSRLAWRVEFQRPPHLTRPSLPQGGEGLRGGFVE